MLGSVHESWSVSSSFFSGVSVRTVSGDLARSGVSVNTVSGDVARYGV